MSTTNQLRVSTDADCSPLMVAAVLAYHRSERDSAARMHESFGTIEKAEDFLWASHRVRTKRDCGRLWFWAMKRWGGEAWPRLEYELREKANAAGQTREE